MVSTGFPAISTRVALCETKSDRPDPAAESPAQYSTGQGFQTTYRPVGLMAAARPNRSINFHNAEPGRPRLRVESTPRLTALPARGNFLSIHREDRQSKRKQSERFHLIQ